MNNKTRIVSITLGFTLCCNLQAQQNSAKKQEVIEVVAQKRKQNIQKVGISVTALPQNIITDLGITSTVGITQQVPGLQLNSWSPNLTIFNMRGVSQNSFTDNLEAPIAVYMDDGYVGSLNAVSGQLFDIQGVEVLRGPQGTLFGRNATGGMIHYISRTPQEDYSNGYIKLGASSFDQQEIELAYGNELTEGLRGRIALRDEQSDGYIKSATGDTRAIGGTNTLGLKAALQWDISDNIQLDLQYKYSKDDDVPTGGYSFLPWTQAEIDAGYLPPELMDFTQNVILDGGEPPGGMSLQEFTQLVFFNTEDGFTPVDGSGRTIYRGDHPEPHKHFSNVDGYLNRTVDTFSGKLTWDIDNSLSFESITNLQKLDKDYLEDGDGIPAPIIQFQTDMDYQQFSQEFRLAGSNEQLRWQLGGFYLDMQHDGLATTVGNPVLRLANSLIESGDIPTDYEPSSGAPQAVQDFRIDSDSLSLFTQLEWSLSEQLTAIAGLRWSQDDKSLNYVRGFVDEVQNISLIQQAKISPSEEHGRIDYDDHALRAQLNWQVTDNHLWFVSYNRGIKVGNWAFSAGIDVSEFKHQPETLHSYELGVKSNFDDPNITLNTTAFYYDYQDYQAFAMLGLAPHIRNSDATVYGAEVELLWQATDHLDISLGGSYLNSEVEQVNAVAQWNSPVGGTVIDFPVDILYDLELPNAPEFSFNYIVKYQWPIFKGNLSAQIDGVYYADQYLEVTNGAGSFQKAHHVANFTLSYQAQDSQWRVDLWVKNVADEVYKQYSLDLGMLGATVYYAKPRSSGISLHYRF